MERHLFKLFFVIVLISLSLPALAQVKLYDSGVTKFYDNGTRITYFKMADFPNSAEVREFVKRIVLENPDINRVVIYTDGKTFMYDAKQSIEPDMVVEAVNEALAEYRASVGDFPPNDPPSTAKPSSNVIVTPHKASSDMNLQQKGAEHKRFVAVEDASAVKSSESTMKTISTEEIKLAIPVNEVEDDDNQGTEKVSPAKYNKDSKNK